MTLVRLVAERGPWCEAQMPGCDGRAVDAHEPLTRARGGSVVDPANLLLVCCHRWVHANPAEATRLELLVPSWERAS